MDLVFHRLAQEGPLPQHSHDAALLPEERCTLQRLAATAASQQTHGTSSSPSTLDCASARPPLRNLSEASFRKCWFVARGEQCGLYRPSATYNTPSDPLLFRYSSLVAPARVGDSYLLRALSTQPKNATLTFIGDSTAAQMAAAARCELGRAKLAAVASTLTTAMDTSLLVPIMEALANRVRIIECVRINTWLAAVKRTSAIMLRDQAGTLVFTFGVHYDDLKAVQAGEKASGGLANTVSRYSRDDLNRHLLAVLPLLHELTERCPNCRVLCVTSFSQHFVSSDGTFNADIVTDRLPRSSYGCRPWPAAPVSGANESLLDELGTSWPLIRSSANSWRISDVLRQLRRFPNIHVVPLHMLSRAWWSLHAGATEDNWRGTKCGGGGQKVCIDCTHLCYSAFLYEPIWWAIDAVSHTGY
tara:strand:- start:2864 stop:4111 length:1248 start_codon:yes stop_codon:yes gene_type:complete